MILRKVILSIRFINKHGSYILYSNCVEAGRKYFHIFGVFFGHGTLLVEVRPIEILWGLVFSEPWY